MSLWPFARMRRPFIWRRRPARPSLGASLYITTKFAVVGLSEALRTELAAENIGVSVLCPGPVQTNIAESNLTRPAHFSNTGYAETDKMRQTRSVSSVYMDPMKVGERVLEGILRCAI